MFKTTQKKQQPAQDAKKEVKKEEPPKPKKPQIDLPPPLSLGQKNIFELPDIELLLIHKRFLSRTYKIIITLLICVMFATAGLFSYLMWNDQFEFALLQDGSDLVCVK